MPTKVDGTNGVLEAYDFQALTTGFSYTFAAGVQTLIINPAGTLATGTITMPAAPADGMVITVESTQQVTAVTVQGNTGQSLVGAAVQLIPNQPLSFVYRLANTTWYPVAGGAGRATTLVSGALQNTTSGTNIDFTGIPSWVKRITVMLSAVSTNGTANLQVQLGTSSGFVTSGYNTSATSGGGAAIFVTTGLITTWANAATNSCYGVLIISSLGNGDWVYTGAVRTNGTQALNASGGGGTVSGTLDRIRLTTVGGTDTFDAGSVNILYE